MCRPNLFVPGFPRSGTTTFAGLLRQHPQIFVPGDKEPHTLVATRPEGPDFSPWQGMGEHAWRADLSSGYCAHQDLPGRIARDFPDARCVFLLRHPVERAWSHYCAMRAREEERRSFSQAIEADVTSEGAEPVARYKGIWLYSNYLLMSRYATLLRRFTEVLPKDQILLVTLEELAAGPRETLRRVADFLGIEPFPESGLLRENRQWSLRYPRLYFAIWEGRWLRGWLPRALRSRLQKRLLRFLGRTRREGYPEALLEGDRKRLVDLLGPEVEELRRLTGRGFEEWAQEFPL